MRLMVAALTLILFLQTGVNLPQTDSDEIRILVSEAPVAEAAAAAQDEERLILCIWLRTLSFSGRADYAFAAASKIDIKELSESDKFIFIAWGLAIAGRIDEALATVRMTDFRDENDEADHIIMILAAADKTDQALTKARKFTDEGYRYQSLESIAKRLARKGKTDQAIAVTREIKDKHYSSIALTVIVEELAKAGKGTEALALARGIKDDLPRIRAIQNIASELARAGKADEALAAVYEITDESSRYEAFRTITERLTQAGDVDGAMIVARMIKDDHLLAISLGDVIKGLTKQGRNDEANGALNEALTRAHKIKCKPDRSEALSTISSDLADVGRISEALEIARSITEEDTCLGRRFGCRNEAFESIGKALSNQGKPDEALAIAYSIKEGWVNRYSIIADVSEWLAQAGKIEQALAIASARFDDPDCDRAAVVKGLAKAGKINEAMAAAREIKDEDARSYAFGVMAITLARSHSYGQARLAADLCLSPLDRLYVCDEILREYAVQSNPELQKELEAEGLTKYGDDSEE